MSMSFKNSFNFNIPSFVGDYGMGIKLGKISGVEESITNLVQEFPKIIQVRLARAVAAIGIDVLSRSLPRAPIETGQLRESAKVQLRLGRSVRIIGKGKKDGTVEADLSNIVQDALAHVRQINLEVSYYRMSEHTPGFDVAQWVHENISEYGGSSPHARTPNTGPKYLEIPWKERERKYRKLLMDVVSERHLASDIALTSKIVQRRVGKYEVNVTKLIARRIARVGYFGGVI